MLKKGVPWNSFGFLVAALKEALRNHFDMLARIVGEAARVHRAPT